CSMKQSVLVNLAAQPDPHAALRRTRETFNAACNAIAMVAFRERCANTIDLHKLVSYDGRRDFGVAAHMAIGAMAQGSAASKREKQKHPQLRPHGAMVSAARMCRFPRMARVSFLTLEGRVAGDPLPLGHLCCGPAPAHARPGGCALPQQHVLFG